MGRPPQTPITALGVAMRAHRGARPGHEACKEIGIDSGMYHRLESGKRGPSAQTARALARWLGWTTDQVLDAAEQAAPMTTEQP